MNHTDLEALADELLEDDDYLDAYEAAIQGMTPADATALARMMEICPIHRCDDSICADDADETCAAARA